MILLLYATEYFGYTIVNDYILVVLPTLLAHHLFVYPFYPGGHVHLNLTQL